MRIPRWHAHCSHQVRDTKRVTLARRKAMNSVIYLVGLIVVVIAILSFFGLR